MSQTRIIGWMGIGNGGTRPNSLVSFGRSTKGLSTRARHVEH